MSATPEQIAERLDGATVRADELPDTRHVYTTEAVTNYVVPLGLTLADIRAAAALIRAQAERVRVLVEKLEKIAGEAPAKEPRDGPTVGPPPDWIDDLYERVADMVQDAFDEGHARACWELGQIADAALKAAP